ncbi:hypothetical protein D3C73_1519340 [compost metagenome]
MTCQIYMCGIHPFVQLEQISCGNRIIYHFILNIRRSCCSSRKLLRVRISPFVITKHGDALLGQAISYIPERFVRMHSFVQI